MTTSTLRSRIETLFADMEHEPVPALHQRHEAPRGWWWECDERGRYCSCSPEVEDILGVRADEFLGKPLETFRLHPQSAAELQKALKSNVFPLKLALDFLGNNRKKTPVAFYILRRPVGNGKRGKWRGFALVLRSDQGENVSEPASIPSRRRLELPF